MYTLLPHKKKNNKKMNAIEVLSLFFSARQRKKQMDYHSSVGRYLTIGLLAMMVAGMIELMVS